MTIQKCAVFCLLCATRLFGSWFDHARMLFCGSMQKLQDCKIHSTSQVNAFGPFHFRRLHRLLAISPEKFPFRHRKTCNARADTMSPLCVLFIIHIWHERKEHRKETSRRPFVQRKILENFTSRTTPDSFPLLRHVTSTKLISLILFSDWNSLSENATLLAFAAVIRLNDKSQFEYFCVPSAFRHPPLFRQRKNYQKSVSPRYDWPGSGAASVQCTPCRQRSCTRVRGPRQTWPAAQPRHARNSDHLLLHSSDAASCSGEVNSAHLPKNDSPDADPEWQHAKNSVPYCWWNWPPKTVGRFSLWIHLLLRLKFQRVREHSVQCLHSVWPRLNGSSLTMSIEWFLLHEWTTTMCSVVCAICPTYPWKVVRLMWWRGLTVYGNAWRLQSAIMLRAKAWPTPMRELKRSVKNGSSREHTPDAASAAHVHIWSPMKTFLGRLIRVSAAAMCSTARDKELRLSDSPSMGSHLTACWRGIAQP